MLFSFALGLALFGGLLANGNAHATGCDDDTPCVAVSFGTPQGGDLSVQPGLSYYDSTQFYLPVEINLKNVNRYTIKTFGSGSSLVSDDGVIPTIGTDTAYVDLGKDGSQWGMRWSFGDMIEDKDTNYHRVPASENDDRSVIVENASLPKSASTITKQLTLGFAVAVDGNQAGGSYTNVITVAVVASPRDARSFFDITTMQEMTSDICANTTTPARTATTQFDTNALHPNDPNFIPETTLTDTRDNKTYLIRKLADGNCWMSQNLSLNLSTDKALTSQDTDLTSKTSWTPTHATGTAGEAWNANEDNSISTGWNQYWAGGTTFNTTGATAQGGAVGYAQRGNCYDWYAATAGSGKPADVYTTTDGDRIIDGTVQDSICPKGWTLPVGGGTPLGSTDGSIKSLYNLVYFYGGQKAEYFSGNTNTLYVSPMNFVPAGAYASDSKVITADGMRQLYWAGTADTVASRAWILNYDSNTGRVYPGMSAIAKDSGLSIRCVAR